jgi:hypothetical protein
VQDAAEALTIADGFGQPYRIDIETLPKAAPRYVECLRVISDMGSPDVPGDDVASIWRSDQRAWLIHRWDPAGSGTAAWVLR